MYDFVSPLMMKIIVFSAIAALALVLVNYAIKYISIKYFTHRQSPWVYFGTWMAVAFACFVVFAILQGGVYLQHLLFGVRVLGVGVVCFLTAFAIGALTKWLNTKLPKNGKVFRTKLHRYPYPYNER